MFQRFHSLLRGQRIIVVYPGTCNVIRLTKWIETHHQFDYQINYCSGKESEQTVNFGEAIAKFGGTIELTTGMIVKKYLI